MPSYVLDQKNIVTPPFEFLGDCYICAVGDGQIRIQRKVGGNFYDMTDQAGVPMVFAGSGVIFNSSVTANKKIEHRIVADTPSEIKIDILKERG